MRILLIGSGGREHALAATMRRTSSQPLDLICTPGNAGIAEVAECPAGATDIGALATLAHERKVDLTIVGPEAPLAAGIVDEFARQRLRIVGPTSSAARLESSKAFAKDFMVRHRIPTAHYRIATSSIEAIEILRRGEFGNENAPVVVKADGLAAGKGVVVAPSRHEAIQAVDDLSGSEAASRIILEETLVGREASLLLFADGDSFRLMPAARDHKRVGENDTGPNTGGMGSVTDRDILDDQTLEQVVREVVEPTLQGARNEGLPFRGILFIGLMLTNRGPQVLEYNVRFGDPETQAILVRLQSDLVELFNSIPEQQLNRVEVTWSSDASACVVLAARGYPGKPEIGARIDGLARSVQRPNVSVFHAATVRGEEGEWLTNGGRVLGVTATGPTLDSALSRSYEAVEDLHWEGMHYRRDIGHASFTGAG